MSKLSDVLSGARVPQQRVEQAHNQPATPRSTGISIPSTPSRGIAIPGANPSGNQQPVDSPVVPAASHVAVPAQASVAGVQIQVSGRPQPATAVIPSSPALVVRPSAPPSDMLMALANTEVQLTNDVADWPELAYANIDVNDVKGQMQVMLLDLQQNMMTNDIGQHLRRIMEFLGAHPVMADTLLPDEFGLIVDALKSSHGVVISAKTENRAKKQSKTKATNELLDAFKDIEF